MVPLQSLWRLKGFKGIRQSFDNEQHLLEVLGRLVRRANQRLDESCPT